MTEQNKTKVPAELIPAGDYPVVSTDAVMDKQKGKTQEEVNEQVDADVEALQQADTNLQEQITAEASRASAKENSLDNRLSIVEELAEISIGGGDAQIATGSDFTDPDATKRAKIPTVGAIVDGLNDGVYDVSKRNPTAGPNSDGKFTLDYILDNANTLIPIGWRHGGMTISFVQSSDNKYVQCFLTKDEWSANPDDWEKTNLEDEVTDINDILEITSRQIEVVITPTLYKEGYYIGNGRGIPLGQDVVSSTGKCIYSSTGWKQGDTIRVSYLKSGGSSVCAIAIYENGEFVENILSGINTNNSIVIDNIQTDFTPDVGYDEVRFTLFSNSSEHINCKRLYIGKDSDVINSIKEEVSQIENELSNVEDSIGDIEDSIGDIEDSIGDIEDSLSEVFDVTNQYDATQAGWINKNNGQIDTSSIQTINTYSVQSGEKYKVTASPSGRDVSAVNYYNGEVFKGCELDMVNGTYTKIISIPSDVTIMRVCGYNGSLHVEKFVIANNIANRVSELEEKEGGLLGKEIIILGDSSCDKNYSNWAKYLFDNASKYGVTVIAKARTSTGWSVIGQETDTVQVQWDNAKQEITSIDPIVIITTGGNQLSELQATHDEAIALCESDTTSPSNAKETAVQTMKNIFNDKPASNVFLVSNFYADSSNTKNNMRRVYRDFLTGMCDYFSCSLIDLTRNSQIRGYMENDANSTGYHVHTTDGIHAYKEIGYKKLFRIIMGNVLAPYLMK